jgi:hypothetical protein
MLASFMVAIEATIVATAMARIVGQLGGFAYYSQVFSVYLLAQCTNESQLTVRSSAQAIADTEPLRP